MVGKRQGHALARKEALRALGNGVERDIRIVEAAS